MHRLIGIACLSGAVMLAACATTEDVEKAQATANQALSAAGAAHSAAQAADQKADLAGQRAAQAAQMAQTANQTAMQAQASANAAQTAAQIATAKSQDVENKLSLAQQAAAARLAQSGRARPAPRVARGERD